MAVAQRIYANALFEAAKEQGRLEPVRDDLHAFADAVAEVTELRALLLNPQLDSRVKRDALTSVLAEADELVRNFVLLTVEKGRAGEIAEIYDELDALVAEEQRLLTVELTTAIELSEEEARQIVEQIQRASGRTVEATRQVDPDLIGGFVLQAGSHRVDASIRGRLERLRHQLVSR